MDGNLIFMLVIGAAGWWISTKMRKNDQKRVEDIVKADDALEPTATSKTPLWLVALFASILPALSVLSLVTAKGSAKFSAGVFLDFALSVAIGIAFTYFARLRTEPRLASIFLTLLWLSAGSYVITPFFVTSYLNAFEKVDATDLFTGQEGAGLLAFILVPGTLVVAGLTSRRYKRVQWMLDAAQKAKVEGKAAPDLTQNPYDRSRYSRRQSVGTQMLWGGIVLVVTGFPNLEAAIVMQSMGSGTSITSILPGLLMFLGGGVLIYLGIRKNKIDKNASNNGEPPQI